MDDDDLVWLSHRDGRPSAVVRCPACKRYLVGMPSGGRAGGWEVRRHGECPITVLSTYWAVRSPGQ